MADISAIFVSIDLYSSTLDRLIDMTNQAVDRLISVTGATKKAVDNMKSAGIIADETTVKMQKSTSELSGMVDKMSDIGTSALKITDKLQVAGATIGEVANEIQGAGTSIDKTADKLDAASDNTKKSSENISKAGKAIGEFKSKVGKIKDSIGSGMGNLFGSVFNLENMQKGMQLIDNISRTNAKLGMINDGNQTPQGLQDKVFAAAGNSRGSYTEMAGTVTKLESGTGDLFKTNDQAIAFTELAQKSVVAGGGNQEERSSSMQQLTDSMTGGGLKGDDLTSLAQTAPAIVDAISSYTGKTGNDLKALADQGGITADVIKNSMFAASGQINDSFAATPMTFEDIWTRIQDGGLQAFSGIMEKITELIETPEFSGFINGLIEGFGMLADGVSWVIDTIMNGWSTIGPVLGGAVIAILAIITANVLIMAFSWLLAALPILLIIGLITAVVIAAMNMGVSWQEIIGVIGGAIGGFGTVFYNIFIFIWNVVADFINFFGNAFNDPVSSILALAGDLAINFIGIIESMVQGIEGLINLIPGVKIDITSGITSFKDSVVSKVDKLKTQTAYKEYMGTKDYADVRDGAKTGYGKGKDFADQFGKSDGSVPDALTSILPDNPYTGGLGGDTGSQIPFDPSQIASPGSPLPVEGTGPGGAVNVEMPEEDLSYLRDIAERDYIANVATNSLAPNISVQFGDVHENADANKVASRIREILQNEIAVASEGVY